MVTQAITLVRPSVYIPKEGEVTSRNRTCQRVALLGAFMGGAILTSGISRSMSTRFLSLGMGGAVSVLCAALFAKINKNSSDPRTVCTLLFERSSRRLAGCLGVVLGGVYIWQLPRSLLLRVLAWNVGFSLSILSAVAYKAFKNMDGTRVLHRAVVYDLADQIKNLLVLGANPNIRDIQGKTPLHLAVFKIAACIKVVQHLIGAGADVKAQDRQGDTALHLAVKNVSPKLEIVNLLIDSEADVNALNAAGETPLHVCLESFLLVWNRTREAMIRILLEKGSDPKFKGPNTNMSALERASSVLASLEEVHMREAEKMEALVQKISEATGQEARDIRREPEIHKGTHHASVYERGDAIKNLSDIVQMMKDWPNQTYPERVTVEW